MEDTNAYSPDQRPKQIIPLFLILWNSNRNYLQGTHILLGPDQHAAPVEEVIDKCDEGDEGDEVGGDVGHEGDGVGDPHRRGVQPVGFLSAQSRDGCYQ